MLRSFPSYATSSSWVPLKLVRMLVEPEQKSYSKRWRILDRIRCSEFPELPKAALKKGVYVPGQTDVSKRLPVIVCIHGGGFVMGSIQSVVGFSFFNGDDLIYGMQQVEAGEDARSWRFCRREVKEEGKLNAGSLDQLLAIQWIWKHITKFGGSRRRLTGGKLGAQLVLEVIANNGQTHPPLFKRGITSRTGSTAVLTQYRYDDSIPEARVLREAKCSNLKCLRKLPEEKLAEVNKEVASRGFFGSLVFVPIVDDSFIRQSPSQALKERNVNGEGILVTINSDEGAMFANPPPPIVRRPLNVQEPVLGDGYLDQLERQLEDEIVCRVCSTCVIKDRI
ncbi:alpha/beta-hydrolase [Hymenopellis radicata]|nr:alpha/beta-hydrolase [Hymenopellis radicata]